MLISSSLAVVVWIGKLMPDSYLEISRGSAQIWRLLVGCLKAPQLKYADRLSLTNGYGKLTMHNRNTRRMPSFYKIQASPSPYPTDTIIIKTANSHLSPALQEFLKSLRQCLQSVKLLQQRKRVKARPSSRSRMDKKRYLTTLTFPLMKVSMRTVSFHN